MNWLNPDEVIEYVPCNEAITVRCDGAGCTAQVTAGRSAKAARHVARKRGWVQIGQRDYCEACASKL